MNPGLFPRSPWLTERMKSKEDGVIQDQKRGRQKEQEPGYRSKERQDPGPSKSQDKGSLRDQGCSSQVVPGSRHDRIRSRIGYVTETPVKISQGERAG